MSHFYTPENVRKPDTGLKWVNKPLLLQLGAQEYTCELILEDNVDLPKLDVIESLESWVVTCYKGKKLSNQCNYNTANKVVPLFQGTI